MEDEPKAFASRLVEDSKAMLLDVADGDASTFIDRVEALAAEWERDKAAATVRAIAELN